MALIQKTNIHKCDGVSFIDAGDFGDLTSSKIEVVQYHATYAPQEFGVFFGQRGGSGGNSEFAFGWTNDGTKLTTRRGGVTTVLGTPLEVFGKEGGLVDDKLRVVCTLTNCTVYVNDVETFSGTISSGTDRVDGLTFRFGARAITPGNDSGSNILEAGNSFGDSLVYIDDVLVCHLAMRPNNDSDEILNFVGANAVVRDASETTFETIDNYADSPTITLDEISSIEVGSTYTNTTTAADDSANDISENLTILGAVNAAEVYLYTVEYYVFDSQGRSGFAKNVVAVNPVANPIPATFDITAGALPTYEALEEHFDSEYPNDVPLVEQDYYGDTFSFSFGSWINFYIDMHKMSGANRWLASLQRMVDFMLAHTDDQLPQVTSYFQGPNTIFGQDPFVRHKGWSNQDSNGQRRLEILQNGNICRHLMTWADYAISNNITGYGDMDAIVDKCIEVLELHDPEFIYNRYGAEGVDLQSGNIQIDGSYYYTNRENPQTHYSNPVAFNHTFVTMDAMHLIAKHRTKPEFVNKIQASVAFWERHVRDHGTFLQWEYGLNTEGGALTQYSPDDVNHANYTINVLCDLQLEGYVSVETVTKLMNVAPFIIAQDGTGAHEIDGTGVDDGGDTVGMAEGFLETSKRLGLTGIFNLVRTGLQSKFDATNVRWGSPFNAMSKLLYTSDVTAVDSTPANQPPVANAGPDQSVAAGATVQLDGTGSTDGDGAIVSYAWTQTAGDTVTLTGAATATPSFTAPSTNAQQTLTFELTITDDGGLTATDSVDVQVAAQVIESTLNAVLTGITDGTYLTRVVDTDNDALLFKGNKSWANSSATFTLSVAVGTNVEYYAYETGENGAGLQIGVTE